MEINVTQCCKKTKQKNKRRKQEKTQLYKN